jgi:hypothetical protein
MDIKATLQLIERLKNDREKNLNKAETDPIQAAKDLGIDLNNFSHDNLDALKSWSEELSKQVEVISNEIVNSENPKSKGVENLLTKIKNLDHVSTEDQDLLVRLMGKYIADEQKKLAENCFHYDRPSCKGGIIDAHSLQKNGPLNRISEFENNQHTVIHFKREAGKNWYAAPISIKSASTFRGFCHHHDDIFSVIEQQPYTGSNQQNFLHSYRSFAYSYHNRIENYAYLKNVVNGASNMENLLESCVEALRSFGIAEENIPDIPKKTEITAEQEEILKAERFETYKEQLNNSLNSNKYDDLEYFTYELNHICPLICASWIKVHLEMPGGFIINYNGQIYNGYPLLLTIFHTDQNTSFVLLARFKHDSITEHMFNQLRKLSTEELENKLTSLIYEQVENFYMAPTFWNYLPNSEKEKIKNDINEEKQSFPNKSNFKASNNIFDKRHKLD